MLNTTHVYLVLQPKELIFRDEREIEDWLLEKNEEYRTTNPEMLLYLVSLDVKDFKEVEMVELPKYIGMGYTFVYDGE